MSGNRLPATGEPAEKNKSVDQRRRWTSLHYVLT